MKCKIFFPQILPSWIHDFMITESGSHTNRHSGEWKIRRGQAEAGNHHNPLASPQPPEEIPVS
jgi:hypothetical protein